ncbi:piggyBac transposable element-derived protein 4-like [Xyrichtys novacula]|uniref:PiggyBac transposable element-derived protein 4-like n=1 Tax=Xyrichtys novacula TaxID=13765 RepID=A0AAV1HID3_XYRNO|nr:piggyBac transposable element-derived protein 4-like [Xyrichtys novacula]
MEIRSGLHSPRDRSGRKRVENIIKMTPGPTRYATSRVDDIKSSFQLFLPESIEGIILDMTNLEGKREFGDTLERTGPGRPPSLHRCFGVRAPTRASMNVLKQEHLVANELPSPFSLAHIAKAIVSSLGGPPALEAVTGSVWDFSAWWCALSSARWWSAAVLVAVGPLLANSGVRAQVEVSQPWAVSSLQCSRPPYVS